VNSGLIVTVAVLVGLAVATIVGAVAAGLRWWLVLTIVIVAAAIAAAVISRGRGS
jgi:hypothetical protein